MEVAGELRRRNAETAEFALYQNETKPHSEIETVIRYNMPRGRTQQRSTVL